MKTPQRKLLMTQLDKKLLKISELATQKPPERGWIHIIRVSLNMTLRQLGARLGITVQGVRDLERREAAEAITLRSLRQAAEGLNMTFVYGFVPKDESIEKMVERRARELARTIVLRTSASMVLEEQGNSRERLEKAIEEKAAELTATLPSYLWN